MELCWPEHDAARCRETTRALCHQVAAAGGRALAVGGCVRDSLLGRPAADLDLEVFGLSLEQLEAIVALHFGVSRVGRSFPILRLDGLPIDLGVPWRDRASRDVDLAATPLTAALRRDFTINAIALDPLTGELLDPLGGEADLRARRLRHTSDRFDEDPLRVLRAMQLVARFGLDVDPETLARCRALRGAPLPRERVFAEWRRLLLEGVEISRGLRFLREAGWLRDLPELEALVGCPQDPEWHPEGCVWTHTLHALDAFAGERVGDEREDLTVGLAVLCHDLGKPATTRREPGGRITSRGHEEAGVEPTRRLLARWTNESRLVEGVVRLVAAHLAPHQLYRASAGNAAIRRLARRVGRIDLLVRVAGADWRGRPPRGSEPFVAGEWLQDRARLLHALDRAPPRLVRGRDLIALGLAPGPELGAVLEACYQAQLDGGFGTRDQGRAFAKREIARRGLSTDPARATPEDDGRERGQRLRDED